jgi:hypothetical protein
MDTLFRHRKMLLNPDTARSASGNAYLFLFELLDPSFGYWVRGRTASLFSAIWTVESPHLFLAAVGLAPLLSVAAIFLEGAAPQR